MSIDDKTRDLTRLRIAHGVLNLSVHEVVANLVEAAGPAPATAESTASSVPFPEPDVVWREPVPTAKRVTDFQGLWLSGEGSLREAGKFSIPLDEARIFWNDPQRRPIASLHVVSANYGDAQAKSARWCALWIDGGDKKSSEWSELLTKHVGEAGDMSAASAEEFAHQVQNALRMQPRDLARFGLGDRSPSNSGKLDIHTWSTDGVVRFWHLTRG